MAVKGKVQGKSKGARASASRGKGALKAVTWQRGTRNVHVIAVHYISPATAPLTLCKGLHTTASPYLGTGGHKVVPGGKVTCQRCISAAAKLGK